MASTLFFPFEPPFRSLGTDLDQHDRAPRRARNMRVAELAYRGWQEASRWLERVAAVDPSDQPDALLRRHAPAIAEPAEAMRMLRHAAPQRFFAGADAKAIASMATDARLSDHRRHLLARADDLLAFRFDLLSYRGLWFGNPIDWHLDPISGRSAPRVPWHLIDLHDPSAGDSRLVFELNRHQWLVTLAQAWSLTTDDRYAAACVNAIDAWIDANPPGVGLNWTSSTEAALRTVSWCWTLLLIRNASATSPVWLIRVLAAIWLHATYIARYLSNGCSQNTDLAVEALALFYVGSAFPEFEESARWREVAVRILVSEGDAQVCRDGVHFERATCYHRYMADTYMHLVLLAERAGVALPGHVGERLQQMVDFLVTIGAPDGTVPALGDDDGGCLLSLQARPPGDVRALLAVAAARFERHDFAWAAGGTAPEIAWLLGDHGMHAFDALRPAPPTAGPSRVFPSGGYASMRSDWAADAHHAILDIGPIGCPVSGGHGHADLLSLQCSVFGEPCIVDPGTYCYIGDPQWRNHFRSTAAHSTVLVDGINQADPAGAFGWYRQPRARLREWHSTPEFDFLDAEHDGYRSLPDPVVHRRRVIFVKPSYWILIDDLSGAERHQLDLMFQFGPLSVALGPHAWARAQTPRGRVLWICPFPSAPVQPMLKCGEFSPTSGWISPGYGERRPAPMLIYSFIVALPWRVVTLLLPDRQALTSPPAVRAIYDDTGRPAGIAFERPRRMVRFSDHAVSVERE